MIAALMVYSLATSILFAAAAVAAERLLRLARRPARRGNVRSADSRIAAGAVPCCDRAARAREHRENSHNVELDGDETFRRLFDGIALSADQEASARATLTETQEALDTLDPPQGRPPILSQTELALAALITNDANRRTVQARIIAMDPAAPVSPR